MFPDQPVLVWHRSFHEFYVNSAALDLVEISAEELEQQYHVDITKGHFYETGMAFGADKFSDYILSPTQFMRGLNNIVEIVHGGGITTIADLAAGMFDLGLEWYAKDWVLEDGDGSAQGRA